MLRNLLLDFDFKKHLKPIEHRISTRQSMTYDHQPKNIKTNIGKSCVAHDHHPIY